MAENLLSRIFVIRGSLKTVYEKNNNIFFFLKKKERKGKVVNVTYKYYDKECKTGIIIR